MASGFWLHDREDRSVYPRGINGSASGRPIETAAAAGGVEWGRVVATQYLLANHAPSRSGGWSAERMIDRAASSSFPPPKAGWWWHMATRLDEMLLLFGVGRRVYVGARKTEHNSKRDRGISSTTTAVPCLSSQDKMMQNIGTLVDAGTDDAEERRTLELMDHYIGEETGSTRANGALGLRTTQTHTGKEWGVPTAHVSVPLFPVSKGL
ncbi:hypothetical protein B0J11DRAFT_507514 [Dendryphion nanum]|uniref:Uncharacterized protein n=1 Tax=Dendryphion nanum TaxID=256645 RepID=A0A9P9DKT8_9PLEO|nr:hypothetical protein B0J11DRAFT_507514 [Dendryphion nanum]